MNRNIKQQINIIIKYLQDFCIFKSIQNSLKKLQQFHITKIEQVRKKMHRNIQKKKLSSTLENKRTRKQKFVPSMQDRYCQDNLNPQNVHNQIISKNNIGIGETEIIEIQQMKQKKQQKKTFRQTNKLEICWTKDNRQSNKILQMSSYQHQSKTQKFDYPQKQQMSQNFKIDNIQIQQQQIIKSRYKSNHNLESMPIQLQQITIFNKNKANTKSLCLSNSQKQQKQKGFHSNQLEQQQSLNIRMKYNLLGQGSEKKDKQVRRNHKRRNVNINDDFLNRNFQSNLTQNYPDDNSQQISNNSDGNLIKSRRKNRQRRTKSDRSRSRNKSKSSRRISRSNNQVQEDREPRDSQIINIQLNQNNIQLFEPINWDLNLNQPIPNIPPPYIQPIQPDIDNIDNYMRNHLYFPPIYPNSFFGTNFFNNGSERRYPNILNNPLSRYQIIRNRLNPVIIVDQSQSQSQIVDTSYLNYMFSQQNGLQICQNNTFKKIFQSSNHFKQSQIKRQQIQRYNQCSICFQQFLCNIIKIKQNNQKCKDQTLQFGQKADDLRLGLLGSSDKVIGQEIMIDQNENQIDKQQIQNIIQDLYDKTPNKQNIDQIKKHQQKDKQSQKQQYLVELFCKHIYHRDCIQSWVKKNKTCPVCRVDLAKNANKISTNIITSSEVQRNVINNSQMHRINLQITQNQWSSEEILPYEQPEMVFQMQPISVFNLRYNNRLQQLNEQQNSKPQSQDDPDQIQMITRKQYRRSLRERQNR